MTNAQSNAPMIGPFTGLRPVALSDIERELDNRWREANAQIAATASHAITRNSVLTLVVVTQSRTEASMLLEAVHALTTLHPSRAIIVAADPTQRGEDITAQIGAYIGQNAASYGEDIVIEAQSEAVRHLPGVILPLIVAGLPSVLWWTGEPPFGTPLLESLIDGSDRFIVDTSEMPNVERSFGALEDLLRRKLARSALSDITWTSQAPWRDIVAQFFDGADARPYLEGIERVTIEYAAGEEDAPTTSSQAYLFAGWLASRLGWRSNQSQPGGVGGIYQHTLRDGGGRPVTVEISPRYGVAQRHWWSGSSQTGPLNPAPWVRYGALMSVHLTSRADRQRGTFAVARERDLAHATTLCQAPGCNIPSQTVHLQSIGERELLASQLRSLGHETVYEEALSAATHLMGRSARWGGK